MLASYATVAMRPSVAFDAMPNADLFAALGFFIRRGFVDADTSARLRAAVKGAPASAATVRTDDRTYAVDRSTRSTEWAEVAPEAVALVDKRLAAIMPEVARHYGISLTGLQPLQFLVYREGDFFERHRDRGDGEDTPAFSRNRRVAAVIFLNGEGEPSEEGFRGGALTLYGLFDGPDAETLGFPLEAEEGLLVTFPADVVHEVSPVEAGERYTVVTWFAGEN
jgi:predicted 2-oxoglutarate/Fe(II)-dependent dioxygenase YbiX